MSILFKGNKAQTGAVSDDDLAYLLVLDQQGKVTWIYRHAFNVDAYNQIARQVRSLLALMP